MEQIAAPEASLTEREQHLLGQLEVASEVIQDAIGRRAPLRRAMVFLSVASYPGISQLEVANQVDGPASTIHTDLQALAETDRHGRPGRKLIERYREAPFGSRFLYRLTAAGERVIERLENALPDEPDVLTAAH
ncbi:hypothetical protein ACFOKI_07435 [Sphingomonas qilianensis]|uniref:MarR family transcriptional regulator n=1 Tax=Sphingomonas qilianensis TaxID=1736690 RepID=A0ABU9XQW9_9SPHN